MNIDFSRYEQLPDSIINREIQRAVGKEITSKIASAKNHWQALRDIQEIAEQVKTLDEALDEDYLNENIKEQIKSLRALPLPPSEIERYVAQWEQLRATIDHHRQQLREAVEYFPDGVLDYEDNDPSTLTIAPEDKEKLELERATVAVPNACKALYERFLHVIGELQAFENWEAQNGLNARELIDVAMRCPDAVTFARAFLDGAWKPMKRTIV